MLAQEPTLVFSNEVHAYLALGCKGRLHVTAAKKCTQSILGSLGGSASYTFQESSHAETSGQTLVAVVTISMRDKQMVFRRVQPTQVIVVCFSGTKKKLLHHKSLPAKLTEKLLKSLDFQMLPAQSTWRPRLQGSAALWTFDHPRSYSAPSGCCRTQSGEGAG